MCGSMSQHMAGDSGPRGGEYAGRVRAAIAYSGLRPAKLASMHDDLTTRTLYNYMTDGGPLTPNGQAYRQRIAKACGVPPWFMEQGFELPAEGARALRLAQMADELAALQRRVGELTEGEETP